MLGKSTLQTTLIPFHLPTAPERDPPGLAHQPAIRERLQEAQVQRRDILTQLTAATDGGQGIIGRQGFEILQQAQALKQTEQEIDAAEAALQAMQQEAIQAGAPLAWLQ